MGVLFGKKIAPQNTFFPIVRPGALIGRIREELYLLLSALLLFVYLQQQKMAASGKKIFQPNCILKNNLADKYSRGRSIEASNVTFPNKSLLTNHHRNNTK